MLKAIFYIGLTLLGVLATLITPFAGVVTGIESYMMNPPAITGGDDGGFRYQLVATVALLISFLIYRPKPVAEIGREVWIMRLLWIFVAIGALSSLWAVVSSDLAINTLYELLKTVIFVAIMVRLVRDERHLSFVVTALIVGAFHAGFMHILGIQWGYVYRGFGREVGVLPDAQTGVMILFVPLLVVTAIYGSRFQKVLAWCAMPFVLDSIVNSYERTGLAAIALQALLLLFYLPRRITFRLLPALLVAGGLLIFRFTPPDYWEKMGTILHPHEEASANSRFVVNAASWQMIRDFPWGVGYHNYPFVSPRYLPDEFLTSVGEERVRAAHNSFFTVLCDTGVEGFTVWILAIGGALLLLRRVRKNIKASAMTSLDAYSIALELGLYGWLLGGWTQDYQEVDPAYWFIGLSVVLIRLARRRAAQAVVAAPEQPAESEDFTASPSLVQ